MYAAMKAIIERLVELNWNSMQLTLHATVCVCLCVYVCVCRLSITCIIPKSDFAKYSLERKGVVMEVVEGSGRKRREANVMSSR
jgi:hypothetical protein